MTAGRLGGSLAGGGLGGAGASGAAGSAHPFVDMLGPLLVDGWDARVGVALGAPGEAATWTGVGRGIVLPALAPAQRPLVALDAGLNNQTTVALTAAGSRGMHSGTIAQVFANGTRPYFGIWGRWSAVGVGGAFQRPVSVGVLATADRLDFATRAPVGGEQSCAYNGNLGGGAIDTTPDTNKHFFEGFANGVQLALYEDGGLAATAVDATIASACTAIGLGCASSTPTVHFADFIIAAFVLCSAAPSAAQRAALLAYGRQAANWAMP